jgi:PhnB protein
MTRNNLDETSIRTLLEARATALRAKDVARVLACYADDAVLFDLDPPLQHRGSEPQAAARLAAWFATWRGPLGVELRDLAITVRDDIAHGHGFVHLHGTKTDGERPDVWARHTVCLRRIDGAWKVTHEHTSVPFYMDGSLKAAVDLTP